MQTNISLVLNEDNLTGSRYVDEFGNLSKKSDEINKPREEQKIWNQWRLVHNYAKNYILKVSIK